MEVLLPLPPRSPTRSHILVSIFRILFGTLGGIGLSLTLAGITLGWCFWDQLWCLWCVACSWGIFLPRLVAPGACPVSLTGHPPLCASALRAHSGNFLSFFAVPVGGFGTSIPRAIAVSVPLTPFIGRVVRRHGLAGLGPGLVFWLSPLQAWCAAPSGWPLA